MRWGLYEERAGWLHAVDPRAKWVLFALGATAPFLFADPWYTGPALALSVAAAVTAGAGRNLLRLWWLYVLFVAVTVAIWTVALPGGGTSGTHGVWFGLGAGFKVVAGMCVGLMFLSCTTAEEMSRGLVGLGVLFRFAFVVAMALRLVPTVVSTAFDIIDAQRSRGLDLESGGLLRRARAHVPLLAPMLLSTLRGADQLSMALECRAFGARLRRTWLLAGTLCGRDVAVMVGAVAYFGVAVALRIAGYGAWDTVGR